MKLNSNSVYLQQPATIANSDICCDGRDKGGGGGGGFEKDGGRDKDEGKGKAKLDFPQAKV